MPVQHSVPPDLLPRCLWATLHLQAHCALARLYLADHQAFRVPLALLLCNDAVNGSPGWAPESAAPIDTRAPRRARPAGRWATLIKELIQPQELQHGKEESRRVKKKNTRKTKAHYKGCTELQWVNAPKLAEWTCLMSKKKKKMGAKSKSGRPNGNIKYKALPFQLRVCDLKK